MITLKSPACRLAALAALLTSFVLPGFAAAPASIAPVELTCEYLPNPLGVDVRQPRLGWKLNATDAKTRGHRQSAYHIVVATDPLRLAREEGDLWDSGFVPSSQSQLVEYAGLPLRSDQDCWWKVRVQDEKGVLADWSRPARWSVGLFETNDWTAKWIGTDMVFERQKGSPPPDNTLADPWLRKAFKLAAKPKRAVIYVASVGYHELHVNGRPVSDSVLAPAVTDHTKRARYVAYDITEFLRPGRNVIGLWLGFSWSIFPPYLTADKPASPMVIAQTDIEFPYGPSVRVETDDTWLWRPSPNTTTGVWDFMHFGGESYDARQEVPNWADASLYDGDWKPVKVFTPKLTLSAQRVQPNRLVKEINPLSVRELRPGVWRFDMGVNFTGWIEADVQGRPGDRVGFKFSERLEQEMTHRLHSAYIIGPTGRGTFRNRFNYGVGRWITVEGLDQKPQLSDLRGWLVRTDYAPASTFSCSNELLTRVHDMALWTYETLSLGGYVVDCAQRERMGYGGDAHATTGIGLNAFGTAALYTKWAEDWRDVQGRAAAWGVEKQEGEVGAVQRVDAGNLPYTAPTYWGGGGPGWSGYCVTLPWELYTRLGDRRILEQMFPTIEAWLAFLETKSRDNLLRRYGGQWDFLGDWLWPGADGVNGDTRETLFFNNCYWIYNLQTAARIADALGRKTAATAWRDRADAVRAATHLEFFNAADNSYVDGLQAYLSIALLTGVPPAELRPAVEKRLEDEILIHRGGHFWAGITGGSFVVKQMIESARPDLMYTMASQETYPGWIHMIRQGATTLWEDWEGRQSLGHSSYLHIGEWIAEGLAGIRPGPDGVGYQEFIIQPGLWPGNPLEWMKYRFDSPYGPIVSEWRQTVGGIEMLLEVPPNTTATMVLPPIAGSLLSEAGQALAKLKGIRELEPGVRFRLESGRYRLDLR
ncbi:MAG: family 78 glycoside hydrolase catalytic domain [Limisphaerales bacterium]